MLLALTIPVRLVDLSKLDIHIQSFTSAGVPSKPTKQISFIPGIHLMKIFDYRPVNAWGKNTDWNFKPCHQKRVENFALLENTSQGNNK